MGEPHLPLVLPTWVKSRMIRGKTRMIRGKSRMIRRSERRKKRREVGKTQIIRMSSLKILSCLG